jgi:hypothetical protein
MKTSESLVVPRGAQRELSEANVCGARVWPLILQV